MKRIEEISIYTIRKGLGGATMEELELVCFQIISFAGEAKSAYLGAIQKAKAGEYEEAERMIKEGSTVFLEAHKVHADLTQKAASGEMTTPPNLILIHAEDQLMSAETCKILAVELIEAYKRISTLEAKEI